MANNFSISIVTFNSDLKSLDKTINSLINEIQHIESNSVIQLETIEIVDNASTTNYQKKLKALIEHLKKPHLIKLTLLTENVGFGQGHNTALFRSKSQYHLFLNPDLEFLNNSLIEGLEILSKNPHIGLVGPKIFDGGMVEQRLHGVKPRFIDLLLRSIAPNRIKKVFNARLNNLYNIPWDKPITKEQPMFISGCCMLVNTVAAKNIIGFSKEYFLYFEDYDFTLRMQKHHSVLLNSQFIVKHYGGNTYKKSLSHWKHYVKSMFKYLYTSKIQSKRR